MSMVRRGVESGARRRKYRDALTSRPEVERLLDVASAPASPRELAGEQAAVDLFARARLVSPATLVAAPKRSSRAAFKAAAASIAAVVAMTSGVSFAATGHVPFSDTIQRAARTLTGHSTDTEGSNGHHARPGDSSSPQGPKAAALAGLCRAFRHGQKATHGHALEARPYTALVAAAGSKDQVEGFCATLTPRLRASATHPTHPSHPTKPNRTHGTNPTHPTHPAHPTHPTHPTHPPSQAHTPKPTHTPKSKPTKQPHPTNLSHSAE
jgi:hypothetical protein